MNSEKITINRRRTARIIAVASGLLFSAFSITYLSVFQKDVMEALHYSLAQGKTVYAPWMSAIIITVVLLVLRWVLNGLTGLKGPLKALSYFPSCLLLGVLTDVGHDVYHGGGISDAWSWMLPFLLVLYVVIAWLLARVARLWLNPEIPNGFVVNSNLTILLLLCFMTVGIGNDNIHFHHELQVEEALRKQEYGRALEVAGKTMDPSRNLTALRAYAMSRQGTMGEELFRYPQLYGAAGLLMGASNDKALRLNADSLYTYLGDTPKLGEPAMKFFERICEEETGNYTTLDYYLSALLLEKRLDKFMQAFVDWYPLEETQFPKYYKQAYYLYNRMHSGSEKYLLIDDAEMDALWEKYETRKQELSGQRGEANYMRREFGNTYWWYYQYK
jgi:hypothetical protein